MSAASPQDSESIDAHLVLIDHSGYFDPEYYRAQRVGLADAVEPIRHYLESGWRDGLNPGPTFDTRYYLAMNNDVRVSGMNPLVHFLRYGKSEGRYGAGPAPHEAVRAGAPTAEEWAALPPRTGTAASLVDVIVPVHRGLAETLRCIYSVLRAPVSTAFELLVVDDASPERDLAAALDELAATGRIRLLRNRTNRGYVQTANFAMGLHPSRDVVLLNSDTEVFGDWLDRLRACAVRPGVGTVTPFSNNAEICSYPWFVRNNDRRLELPDSELDALVAEVNRGETVDLPTAVGFCMYVTRACLDAVGWFDELAFGSGYGEENDLCRRALRAGWRSVLAADVFVRHYGGTSFGEARPQRHQAAFETVARLHPDYPAAVRDFIAADPVLPYRRRIDVARVRRRSGRPAFLFVTHNRGGGTERHVIDLAERIAADGGSVLFCRADGSDGSRLRFEAPSLCVPNLPPVEIPDGLDAFVEAASTLGVSRLHVHHLADLPALAADFFRTAAARLTIPYDVTIHDYFFICPRINLIDDSGFYCGEPDESGCKRCLSHAGSQFGAPPIWTWRDRYARFLRGARSVFVPDADVAHRLRRYVPGLACRVRPHPEEPFDPLDVRITELLARAARPARPDRGARRRIGLIGAIGAHKGSRLLLECARLVRDRALPIDLCVIGYTDVDSALREAGVTISGAYAEHELRARIDAEDLDLAWIPSVWPETYCYTLSAALRARVFPVVFDLGALAARLRMLGWGHIMPLELFFEPQRVVEILASLQPTPVPASVAAPALDAGSAFIDAYYDLGRGNAAERDPMPAYDPSDRFVELAQARALRAQ